MIKEHYTIKDFSPLIIIIIILLACSVSIPLTAGGGLMFGMRIFMGGFFLVFGALKVMRLRDFVSAYQMYDIVAMRSKPYAYAYPFIELLLGVCYLINASLILVNTVTLIVMIISAIGVYIKLKKKEKIMCACLGTVFKVPMTWVTLVEDVLMAVMALGMLVMLGAGQTPTQDLALVHAPYAQQAQVVELSDGDTFDMTATIVKQEVGNRVIKRLAYNGQIPGPIIKVHKGATITINLTNNIDIDTTLHSHGIRIDNMFDGVPNITQDPIMPGETFSYTVTFPDEGAYWYHPHIREDYTQELGLYGNYIVEGDEGYWAPADDETYMIVDDFLEDGEFDPNVVTHTLMGRFGDRLLINDTEEYVYEAVAGEVNRMYLTNVANTRVFDLEFEGAIVKHVGGDIGRVQKETMVDHVVLAPAERSILDVVYESPGTFPIMHHGQTIGRVVVSDSELPPTQARIAFDTLRDNSGDYATILNARDTWMNAEPDKSLLLTIFMSHGLHADMMGLGMDHSQMMGSMHHDGAQDIEWEDDMPRMNEISTDENLEWQIVDQQTSDENMMIDWKFTQGDMVKIRVYNDPRSMHPMQHPIHFHGQRFVVLARDGEMNPNLSWKDTALVRAGETIDLLVEMSNPGTWMAHCHIAEHLHAGMMFGFEVE